MASIVRYLTFAIVVTGCDFASPWPDDPPIPPAPAPTPQPCRTNEPGVVLCVDFEDDSLAVQAIDRSPFANHAIAHDVGSTDRPVQPPPATERAARLEGVSSLRVPESKMLDLPAFTIEMWIYPDRAEPRRKGGDKVDHGLFDNYGQYTMRLREDLKIRCGVGLDGEARVSSDRPVPGQTWSHVACTFVNGETRVYVNGHLSDCDQTVAPTVASPFGSAIGSEIDPAGFEGLRDRFLGRVDNVRIYDRALEAATLCTAAGHTMPCDNICPGSDSDSGSDEEAGD